MFFGGKWWLITSKHHFLVGLNIASSWAVLQVRRTQHYRGGRRSRCGAEVYSDAIQTAAATRSLLSVPFSNHSQDKLTGSPSSGCGHLCPRLQVHLGEPAQIEEQSTADPPALWGHHLLERKSNVCFAPPELDWNRRSSKVTILQDSKHLPVPCSIESKNCAIVLQLLPGSDTLTWILQFLQVWKAEQAQLVQGLQGKTLCLARVGRADSSGYSTKYGTYSLMEMNVKRIIHFELVQVGHRCFFNLSGYHVYLVAAASRINLTVCWQPRISRDAGELVHARMHETFDCSGPNPVGCARCML